jgi:type 1 glutamine amidotransferase
MNTLMSGSSSNNQADNSYQILIFYKTVESRHKSIEVAVSAVDSMAKVEGFLTISTDDAEYITENNLQKFKVVIFLNTSGDVLSLDQQQAFQKYIHAGGGFVGIHGATNTEYQWEWYGRLVGAYFKDHPKIQAATIKIIDRNHPSTAHLPPSWNRTDEWYNWRELPDTSKVKVLAILDESTYHGGIHGNFHPFCWCQEFEDGRSWYTAGGHTQESYSEYLFLKHILGGIRYSAGIDK